MAEESLPQDIIVDPAKSRWRFVVKFRVGEMHGKVAWFYLKKDAKDLRARLRAQYPEIEFWILYDAPKPRWKQVKAHINAVREAAKYYAARDMEA